MNTGNSRDVERLDQQHPARDAVIRQVSAWNGVSIHEHRFGGVEFRLGHRELGHLHPLFADLPFPHHVRDELVRSGRAKPHHVVPNSGWVTVPMRTAPEAENVIALFQQNYERAKNSVKELKLEDGITNMEKEKDNAQ